MRMPLTFALVLTIAMAVVSGVAQAKDVQFGDLVIETPWTRATPGGAKVGVGYLAIVNIGDKADTLTSVSSPIADRVEIHATTMENGVMRMSRVENGLVLKPQEVTELKPGGMHLMFIGLNRAIAEGELLPVEVTFAVAGKVQLTFVAAGIGATTAPGVPNHGGAGGSRSGISNGAGGHDDHATHGRASGENAMKEQKGSH